MRTVVAGSRSITERRTVWSGLDLLFCHTAPTAVVSGLADGPDTFGLWWAVHHGYRVEEYPAEWSRYGRSAGYRRNETMAQVSDAVIAFYDGISRGTRHMIDLARQYNRITRIVRTDQ